MSVFDNRLMTLITRIEGGYVNDPDDPGGETKYGISKASYPKLDIPSLTITQAYEIYTRDYWNKYGISRINSQDLADRVMIAIINLSPNETITCLQRAIADCTLIKIDGVFGSETIEAVNNLNCPIVELFRLELAKLYVKKANENERKRKYLLGWLNRALL